MGDLDPCPDPARPVRDHRLGRPTEKVRATRDDIARRVQALQPGLDESPKRAAREVLLCMRLSSQTTAAAVVRCTAAFACLPQVEVALS